MENIKKALAMIWEKEAHLKKLYDKLNFLRHKNGLKVSDHALVRYLERVHKIDMDEVRDEILTDELRALYDRVGDGTLPVDMDSSIRVVIENGVIKTVIL